MGAEGGMHVEASTAGSSFTSPAWCVSLSLSRAKPGLPDYHCQGVCTCAFVCGNLLSHLWVQPKFNKGCLCSIKTISCRQTRTIMKPVSPKTWGNLTAAASRWDSPQQFITYTHLRSTRRALLQTTTILMVQQANSSMTGRLGKSVLLWHEIMLHTCATYSCTRSLVLTWLALKDNPIQHQECSQLCVCVCNRGYFLLSPCFSAFSPSFLPIFSYQNAYPLFPRLVVASQMYTCTHSDTGRHAEDIMHPHTHTHMQARCTPSGGLAVRWYFVSEHFAHAFPDSSHTLGCLSLSDLCQARHPPHCPPVPPSSFPSPPSSSSSLSSPRACGLDSCGQAGCSACGKHPLHMEDRTDPSWPLLAAWVSGCLFPNPMNALFDSFTTTYVPTLIQLGDLAHWK